MGRKAKRDGGAHEKVPTGCAIEPGTRPHASCLRADAGAPCGHPGASASYNQRLRKDGEEGRHSVCCLVQPRVARAEARRARVARIPAVGQPDTSDTPSSATRELSGVVERRFGLGHVRRRAWRHLASWPPTARLTRSLSPPSLSAGAAPRRRTDQRRRYAPTITMIRVESCGWCALFT